MIAIEIKPVEEENSQIQSNGWKEKIQVALNELGFFYTKIKQDTLKKMVCFIVGFSSSKNHNLRLRTLWNFELKSKWLLITVKTVDKYFDLQKNCFLNEDDITEPLMCYLTQLNQKIEKVNRGCFYTQKNKKYLLCFRSQLSLPQPTYSFNSAVINYLVLLGQTVSTQIISFCQFFALSSQPILQPHEPHSKAAFDIVNKLKMTKQHFQQQRQKRPKSTPCSLSFNRIKLIRQLQQVFHLNFAALSTYRLPQIYSQHQLRSNYEQLLRVQKQKALKFMDNSKRYIMSAITINSVQGESLYSLGGFCRIIKGMYSYRLLGTINKQINASISQHMVVKEEELIVRGLLAKKECVHKHDFHALKNEFKLLKFLRNQKSLFIAHYYCNFQGNANQKTDNLQEPKQLFIDHYDKNLKEHIQVWSKRKKIKAINQIIRALKFLQEQQILHRDLKQRNVMIDNNGDARLIDFGSGCGFEVNRIQNGNFVADNNELCSTPNYYLCYQDILQLSLAEKYTQAQFQRSPFFDIYSFGHTLEQVFNLRQKHCQSLVDLQLMYLASKCKEMNPQDRLSCEQVLIYLDLVTNLFVEESLLCLKKAKKQVIKQNKIDNFKQVSFNK